MKKLFVITVLFIGLNKICFSQDSLDLYKTLNRVEKTLRKDLTFSIDSLNNLLFLSKKASCISCLAKVHSSFAILYYNNDNINKTSEHVNLELKYNFMLKDSSKISLSYYKLALYYNKTQNFKNEWKSIISAIEYAPKNDKDLLFNLNVLQANSLVDLEDYKGLLKIVQPIYNDLNKNQKDSLSMSYLADFLAVGYLNTKEFNNCYDYLFKFEQFNVKNFSKRKLGNYYFDVSSILIDLDSLELAHLYLKKAEKLFPENQEKTNRVLANYYYKTGQYTIAERLFNSVLINEKGLKKRNRIKIYENLIDISIKSSNQDKINNYLKKYIACADSINSNLYKERIKFVSAIRDFEFKEKVLKEKELKAVLLSRQAERNLYFISIAFIIVFLIALATYIYIIRRKNIIVSKAKQGLEDALSVKSKFLKLMTHELRTPLNTIVGTVHLMQDDKDQTSLSDHINTLKFSSSYIGNLIENSVILRKFNKLKYDNDLKLESTNFYLDRLILEAGNTIRFLENKNNFKIDFDNNLPTHFKGPKVHLMQVILNLINNANKFTENGLIKTFVTGTQKDNSTWDVTIKISDNGCGIPEEEQKNVFKEFFSGKDKFNKNSTGMGLGLTLTKKLLSLYNSNIFLESKVNLGTDISFTINLEEATPSQAVLEFEISNSPCLVLLVEDNLISQKVMKKIINNLGIDCHVASGGKEAISKFKINKYDLVLMDIMMPDLNGYETSKLILDYDSSANIILLTGVTKKDIKTKAKGIKINGVLSKPVVIDELKQVIRETMLNKQKY